MAFDTGVQDLKRSMMSACHTPILKCSSRPFCAQNLEESKSFEICQNQTEESGRILKYRLRNCKLRHLSQLCTQFDVSD